MIGNQNILKNNYKRPTSKLVFNIYYHDVLTSVDHGDMTLIVAPFETDELVLYLSQTEIQIDGGLTMTLSETSLPLLV